MRIEPLESRIAPAVFIVTNVHDSGPGSLRDAITQANLAHSDVSDTITFAAGVHGKIALKSALPAILDNVPLAITGPGATKLSIDGGGKQQIFYLGDGQTARTVSISGLTLKNGVVTTGTNATPNGGGAIGANEPGGYVTITDCTITGNKTVGLSGDSTYAGAKGGAIDFESGTLTISHSVLSGNSAVGGTGPTGTTGGYAQGGALYVGLDGTVSIDTSIISGNKALGGVGLAGAKGLPMTDLGGAGNYGYGGGYGGAAAGGGVFNAGQLLIKTSTISGNSALGGHGGAGGAGGAGGKGNNSYIAGDGGDGGNGGNGGNGLGGGIANATNLSLTVNSSTISGNIATAGAAGLAGAAGKAGKGISHMNGYTYHGSTGNLGTAGTAGTSTGGGLNSAGSYFTLSQVTIASNTAGQGGGISLYQNIGSEIHNCTIAYNKALQDGGGLFVTLDDNSDPVNLISTVIAKNSAPTAASQDISGTVSADHSFIGIISGATIADMSTVHTGDALLGVLADNGGPTHTILAKAGSALIDAGSNPDNLVNDQRDIPFPRVFGGGIDIGAVEIG